MNLSAGQKKKIREFMFSVYYTVPDILRILNISKNQYEIYTKTLETKKCKYIPWMTKDIKSKLKNWDHSTSISKFALENNLESELVRRFLKNKYGTKSTFTSGEKKNSIKITPEFLEKLSNPKLSSYDLSVSENINRSTIKYLRKKYFPDFKLRKDYRVDFSSFEKSIASILDSLDIVYFDHFYILDYNIDFYLGSKTIIEVGHSKFHPEEKDSEKISVLIENGYNYYSFDEKDLEDTNKLKNDIFNIWDRHIRNGMK